jgi:uncharacterized repeat protein (TIGR03803 family)
MKKTISTTLAVLTFFSFLITTNVKAQYTKLLDFAGAVNGNQPSGDFYSDGIYLYGMTRFGGTNTSCSSYGCGVIFKIKPDGTGYSKLLDFDGTSNGGNPYGSLISDGTFLFGMTSTTVFKIKPDGTGYFTLLNFTGANGADPVGSLISDGTFLYGMTRHGGSNSLGLIFKIMPDGSGYTKLLDFTGANGADPRGTLIYDGTNLYGMTRAGGVGAACGPYGCGMIFKIKTDGTGFTDLYDFDGITSGSNPSGSLVSDGTFLYGMTMGTIFKIMPNGNGYVKLLDFTGGNGNDANASLVFDGTFLYGMTGDGGANNTGVLFQIKPDGTGYVDMFDFANSNGATPGGSLVLSGNMLYGMTLAGGINNMGVIFNLNPAATELNKIAKKETEISVFPNPATKTITVNIITANSTGDFTFRVNNSQGKTVYSENLKEVSGSFTKQIDLSSLAKGTYFIELHSNLPDDSNSPVKSKATKLILH